MLTIRLSRIGKKKNPMYRLIISEKARDPYGRALEILGSYNPFTKELDAKKDRIEHWLARGAKMSATVNNLLVQKEIIKADKVRAYSPKKKKQDGKKDETAKPAEKDENKDKKTEGSKEEKQEVKADTKEDVKDEQKPEEKNENNAKPEETANKEDESKKVEEKKEEPKTELKEEKIENKE